MFIEIKFTQQKALPTPAKAWAVSGHVRKRQIPSFVQFQGYVSKDSSHVYSTKTA